MDLSTVPDDMLSSPAPGIAFEVGISDCSVSPLSMPKRVRRRLLETTDNRSKSPASLQDIEAKLKEADSRRQQFHEWLVNKARPKVRSPSRSLQPEDLAQRLEAKLVAAEQKRLELLAQEQTRLARSQELRAAARTEVQLRAEREREELESKVESRVQQAETNRLALLEAEKQRRAMVHERMAQSIVQRMTQEGKDRERVETLRALICQKIAAAEEKRASLLKAERTRAQALVLQARRVAKAVLRKREMEMRNKKELLEARLQRAKRRRAEYLGQRGGCQGACHNNLHKMRKHGDRLCQKLTRCWRQFRHSRHTTLMLAQDFTACNIDQQSVTSLPFEELAGRITSSASLRSVKALLARLESRFLLSSTSSSAVAKINHLLRRLFPENRKAGVGNVVRPGRRIHLQGSSKGFSKETGKVQNATGTLKGKDPQKSEEKEMERYPARVFLCAYMIIGHSEAVFSTQGEREVVLSKCALKLLQEFEALVSIILNGPPSISQSRPESPNFTGERKVASDSENSPARPFASQLAEFDAAWCAYLYEFVAWKVQDAQLLEEDLIRVACQLELSMLQKCNFTPDNPGVELSHDVEAIRKQVVVDQQLLRERILHLTSSTGVARMDAALSEVRIQFLEARERGSPCLSPFASPQKAKPCGFPSFSPSELFKLDSNEGSGEVNATKSLLNSFNDAREVEKSSVQHSICGSGLESVITEDQKAVVNERLVNEMLHERSWGISNLHPDASKTSDKLGEIQGQIKRTVEDAFWDGVLEGVSKDPPDYRWVIGLLKDMRTDLDGLVPENWKQELKESLDIEIFSQVLESGSCDYEYFRKLLDYAMSIVLKLGAPARDNDLRTSHQLLVTDLSQIASDEGEKRQSSFGLALVKGLRFVLQQIQILKADISAARIQALAPVIQGSAGIEYLQLSFSKRYQLRGLSENIHCSEKLPKTVEWLRQVKEALQQDREELETLQSAYLSTVHTKESSRGLVQPMPLMRTGASVIAREPSVVPRGSSMSSTGNEEQRALQWRSTYTFVGLGMLHIVCALQAVAEDTIAETLRLNIHRLRKAQNDFQRIVIMATGLLLLRQNATGRGLAGPELENILKSGRDQLDAILNDSGVTISQIGCLLARVSFVGHVSDVDVAANGDLMTRVLSRSLSPDDAVFKHVSAAVQTSLRAIILLGKGVEGLAMANLALQRIGATCLQDSVANLGSYMERLASVSCSVHGPWYANIVASV